MAESYSERAQVPEQPSLSELLQSLVADTRRLVRDEIDLARTEMKENARRALREAIILAAGATMVLFALVALMMAATFGLAAALTPATGRDAALWLSPLIMCLVAAAAGALLIRGAIARLKARSLAPKRAIESARDTAKSLMDRLQ
jgi:hypothetical protein